MNAERSNSATNPNPSTSNARDRRVKLAGETIDRLDIARHLLLAEPVSCRLALAMRLLQTTVDDVAELAGIEDETARQAEAIARAAAPVRRKRRPGMFQRLDQLAFVVLVGAAGAFVAGWIVYSFGFHLGLWS